VLIFSVEQSINKGYDHKIFYSRGQFGENLGSNWDTRQLLAFCGHWHAWYRETRGALTSGMADRAFAAASSDWARVWTRRALSSRVSGVTVARMPKTWRAASKLSSRAKTPEGKQTVSSRIPSSSEFLMWQIHFCHGYGYRLRKHAP
jgi:hypothetical protein